MFGSAMPSQAKSIKHARTPVKMMQNHLSLRRCLETCWKMPPALAVRKWDCLSFDPSTSTSMTPTQGVPSWHGQAAACAKQLAPAWTMKLENKVWKPVSFDYILVKELKLEVDEVFVFHPPKPKTPKKARDATAEPGFVEAGEKAGEQDHLLVHACPHVYDIFLFVLLTRNWGIGCDRFFNWNCIIFWGDGFWFMLGSMEQGVSKFKCLKFCCGRLWHVRAQDGAASDVD